MNSCGIFYKAALFPKFFGSKLPNTTHLKPVVSWWPLPGAKHIASHKPLGSPWQPPKDVWDFTKHSSLGLCWRIYIEETWK